MLPKYKTQILNTFWNSCVDNALGALSEMIKKEVKITKSSINIEPLNRVPELMDHIETSNLILYTKVAGNPKYVILLCSPLKHYLRLIDMLLHMKIDYYEALNEENEAVVLELGNIINGYIISSLNHLFDTKFNFDKTEISTNPFRVVEDFGFGNIYKEKINVLAFNSVFKVNSESIEGKLILLTERDKVDIILDRISNKLKVV
ncbi:MAG: hypothetical protein ABIE55_04165 [Candidatus Aenigmatarchaeota archaeon]